MEIYGEVGDLKPSDTISKKANTPEVSSVKKARMPTPRKGKSTDTDFKRQKGKSIDIDFKPILLSSDSKKENSSTKIYT